MRTHALLWLTISFVALVSLGCEDDTPLSDPRILEEYPGLEDPYHILEEVDYERSIELLEGPEVSIVYFGWGSCPWCAEYVPYFNRIGKERGVERIYKFNVRETRVVVEDPVTGEFSLHPDFQRIVDILGPENLLTTTRPVGCEGDECQELPWFTVPSLFVVREGEILAQHIGAVAGHGPVDGMLPPLDEAQRATLIERLEALFEVALAAE